MTSRCDAERGRLPDADPPALLFALAVVALAACGGGSHNTATQRGLLSGAGSAGSSESYQPTGDIVADTGFRPDKNGFSFENYPNFTATVPQNLTSANVEDLFGSQVCLSGTGSSCMLTPTVQQWMEVENKRVAGGHCMGFSVTALRFFGQNLDPSAWGSSSPFGLSICDNLSLQSEITENWTFQDLTSVRDHPLSCTRSVFFKRDGTGGDAWHYVGGINPTDTSELYDGDAQTQSLMLFPTGPGLGQQPCPFCSGESAGSSSPSAGSALPASQQYYSITLIRRSPSTSTTTARSPSTPRGPREPRTEGSPSTSSRSSG